MKDMLMDRMQEWREITGKLPYDLSMWKRSIQILHQPAWTEQENWAMLQDYKPFYG